MSPECQNCGAHVTPDYERVFSRDGDGVECCPYCPDRIRRGGRVEDARSSRENNGGSPRVATDGGDG